MLETGLGLLDLRAWDLRWVGGFAMAGAAAASMWRISRARGKASLWGEPASDMKHLDFRAYQLKQHGSNHDAGNAG